MNNIGSYSPSGSEAGRKFSTSFGSESRQNSSRSIYRRRSISIRSTVSRPSEMGWRTSLRRSGPLSYDVKVGDQIYSRLASQLLHNRTGHQDLSDTQQEQLLDIHPPPRQSESQEIPKPGAKFQISDQTSEGGEPHGKSEKSTSTTHLKGQHKEALPPTFQRASTSTR